MRRGILRRLIKANPGLTWNQASGAYDPKSGMAGYRTIEGREYKEPTNSREEKAAVDRIVAAANKRRRKAGLPELPTEEFTNEPEGKEEVITRAEEAVPAHEGSEGRSKGTKDGTNAPPELDFGSFLVIKSSPY